MSVSGHPGMLRNEKTYVGFAVQFIPSDSGDILAIGKPPEQQSTDIQGQLRNGKAKAVLEYDGRSDE
jgi:hypothetical protein